MESIYTKILLQYAATYGSDVYGCGKYNVNDTCGQTTDGGIFAPDTGLFAQPPLVLYPSLLALGVILGTLSFLITRQIKKLRSK